MLSLHTVLTHFHRQPNIPAINTEARKVKLVGFIGGGEASLGSFEAAFWGADTLDCVRLHSCNCNIIINKS